MLYLLIIALVALIAFMAVREYQHRSLVIDLLVKLQAARAAVVTDANTAKSKIDAALMALKAKLP